MHTSAPGNGRTQGDNPRAGAFASLAYRDYRLIWIGQTTHAFALWMENIARPVLVLQITGNDAAQLGGVIAVRTLPTVVLGLWAGVVADWFDRRLVLLTAKAASFVISTAFALLLLSGHLDLWHIYGLALLRGSIQAFDQPTRASLIPSVVPAALVTNAMALLSSTQNLARIFGAAGAGLSITAIGLKGTFILIAALYAAGVLATVLLRVEAHQRPADRGARAMIAGVGEGLRFARGRPEVLAVLVAAFFQTTFGTVYLHVFAPLFAVDVLEIGAGGLGFLLSLTGLGALIAGLAVARRPPARLGLVVPLAVSGMGVTLVGFSASTYLAGPTGRFLPFAVMTLLGATQAVFFALARSVLVLVTPDALRGRVLSLISLDRAAMSAGAAAGGLLAAAAGVQVAQLAFGVICAAGGLSVLGLMPALRTFRVDRPEMAFRPAEAADERPD